jgi:hypothetical protein
VAGKPLKAFKRRIRHLIRRSGGRSMPDVAERPRAYVLGWRAYFRLARTAGVFKTLEAWMRHRVRAVQFKHWKRGKTISKALIALGAKPDVARRVAANSRRWWRNSGQMLNAVLTLKWMDALGIPRLA